MNSHRALLSACVGLIASAGGGLLADQAGSASGPPRAEIVRVLLVTGGHDYDKEPFHAMFEGHPDIVVRHVEQPQAQEWFAPDKADAYDVMVWYDMYPRISESARDNLVALMEKGKPLVALHHALAGYREWPGIVPILGGHYFLTRDGGETGARYKHDMDMKVTFPNPAHPIVHGMEPFTIRDEAYKGFEVLDGVEPLLATDHPESGPVIGWTHRVGKSPVAFIALGHDAHAYNNPNYRRLVAQSIRWAAGLLPDPSEEGFVKLFDGRSLEGWHVMGRPEGFTAVDGILRSESGKGGDWLRSDRQYGDFILRLDWRISPQGNSGVFIRCTEEGDPWVTGNEVQITHEHRDDLHCTGSLYGRVAVAPRPDERPNVWHTYEIQCIGPRIRVIADGVPVVDVDKSEVPAMRDLPLRGYIGLQDSHNPGGWVEFRNIRIKVLD